MRRRRKVAGGDPRAAWDPRGRGGLGDDASPGPAGAGGGRGHGEGAGRSVINDAGMGFSSWVRGLGSGSNHEGVTHPSRGRPDRCPRRALGGPNARSGTTQPRTPVPCQGEIERVFHTVVTADHDVAWWIDGSSPVHLGTARAEVGTAEHSTSAPARGPPHTGPSVPDDPQRGSGVGRERLLQRAPVPGSPNHHTDLLGLDKGEPCRRSIPAAPTRYKTFLGYFLDVRSPSNGPSTRQWPSPKGRSKNGCSIPNVRSRDVRPA